MLLCMRHLAHQITYQHTVCPSCSQQLTHYYITLFCWEIYFREPPAGQEGHAERMKRKQIREHGLILP